MLLVLECTKSTLKKYKVINLNTLSIHYIVKNALLDYINRGGKVVNAKVDKNIKVNRIDTKSGNLIAICEYGDSILLLDATSYAKCDYEIHKKEDVIKGIVNRDSNDNIEYVLDKVDNELIEHIGKKYEKQMRTNSLLGLSNEFEYIILDKDNIVITKYKGTNDTLIVPKFVNSISKSVMGFREEISKEIFKNMYNVTTNHRLGIGSISKMLYEVVSESLDTNEIEEIVLHKDFEYIDYKNTKKLIRNEVKYCGFGRVKVI